MPADGEIHRATALVEFLGDLATRCASADDQYRPGRQLFRVAVSARMHVEDVRGHVSVEPGNLGSLIRTSRDDHCAGFQLRITSLNDEPLRTLLLPQLDYLDAAAHRRANERRIVLDEPDHLVAMGEPLPVSLVGVPGQMDRPVRELKGQGVPACAAPALGHASPLENNVLTSELGQVAAHGEPCLAAADDDRVVLLAHAPGAKETDDASPSHKILRECFVCCGLTIELSRTPACRFQRPISWLRDGGRCSARFLP